MASAEILLSFVGNRDPYVERGEEPGPLLSLLQARRFHRAYLFCTGTGYLERARAVEELCRGLGSACRFSFVSLELQSPIDYEEIYTRLSQTVSRVLEGLRHRPHSLSVLLDPGTPQMQTAWFLLARSGALPARLLQGIPPRFAGGAYKVKEVNLRSRILPQVRIPEERESAPLGSAADRWAPSGAPAPEEQPRWIALEKGGLIVGEDAGFLQVLERAAKVAAYDLSLLITGETGTGKGLLARFVHERSDRCEAPFVSVNCSAISPQLAESELFGHRKGSFTGAVADRPGMFQTAQGGTVFLDEIGDLPLELQPKLLRALEEKVVQPLGGDREIPVDVRILAATNHDLARRIAEGSFRRDLYERLNQFNLRLPPLRERKGDIPLLIRLFLQQWNEQYDTKGLSDETLQYLLDYPWPGNVRELHNAVRGMCAIASGTLIEPQLLPHAVLAHFDRRRQTPGVAVSLPEKGIDLKAFLYRVERDLYAQALERAGDNRVKAAQLLGVNAPAFRKALRERFEGLADG